MEDALHCNSHGMVVGVDRFWVVRAAGWAEWLSGGEKGFDGFVSQNDAIDAIVATVQQILISSAQPVRHGGQVISLYPSFKLPRRGHFFAARSAKKRRRLRPECLHSVSRFVRPEPLLSWNPRSACLISGLLRRPESHCSARSCEA